MAGLTLAMDKSGMREIEPPQELLDYLYAAATDFDNWRCFLERLARWFDADGSHFLHYDFTKTQMSFSVLHGFDQITDATIRKFESLGDGDPRLVYVKQHPEKPFSCRLVLSEQELHESRVYQEVLRPIKAEYTLGVGLPNEPDGTSALGVFRPPGKSPFDSHDCDCLGRLVPHLKRVVKLQKQFLAVSQEQWSALSSLDGMPIGIIVCDVESRILFANDMARTIARASDGLEIRNEELRAGSAAVAADLRTIIRRSFEPGPSGRLGNSRSLAVPRRESSRPLYLRVSALTQSNAPFPLQNLARPVCVIFVSDPDRPTETEPELLQRLFGLTVREALLLQYLVLGLSVDEVAKEMGIAVSTVRSHLKTVFKKTATDGQADLIRRVARSPAWREL